MSDSTVPSGWSRDSAMPNTITKKYDPHAATRSAAYAKTLAQHQKKQAAAGSSSIPKTSADPKTFEDRRAQVLRKKEEARQAKIDKARKMNERAAANRAKIASGNKAANPASGSQPKVDPTRKENAKHVCATCGGSEQLEADCDAVGVFYCRSCWESYEQGR